jgi:NADP-dependent 3-hydroxy acid dehydrogenase YdfG
MPISLKDKIVLIVGASSGFGQEAAHLFAQEGCRVVLAARRLDLLQTLATQIQSDGGEAMAIPLDVADRREIEVMVKTVVDLYGRIDIVFNNAGFLHPDWLEYHDPGRDIETQVDVNLLGVIQVTRAVLPHMFNREEGHIINMSSVAGWIAPPRLSVYSATKFGVRAFTDALRREVEPFNIKVSGIYPGPARTELGRNHADGPLKKIAFMEFFFPPMDAYTVANAVVAVAKRPRRAWIFPWYYRIAIFCDRFFPWLVDWFVVKFMVKRYHNPYFKDE